MTDNRHIFENLIANGQIDLYILMKHGHDPEEAIARAVNDTKDNDTIAAIVGAVVGALHGKRKLPERWITHLSGRTTDRDDGRVCELIRHAEQWVKKGYELEQV